MADAHALVGQKTGETFRLGDSVDTRLVEAVPDAGALRFELLSEGQHKSQVLGKDHADSVGKPGGGTKPTRDKKAGKKTSAKRSARKSSRR